MVKRSFSKGVPDGLSIFYSKDTTIEKEYKNGIEKPGKLPKQKTAKFKKGKNSNENLVSKENQIPATDTVQVNSNKRLFHRKVLKQDTTKNVK
ncbi:MAG: hypothetical protein HC905_18025 [Bacteroidales bacterium]|nr:hypothetical protein [Bacteroidales bacterium]